MGGCDSCSEPRYTRVESVDVFYFDADWAELEHLTFHDARPEAAALAVGQWLQYLCERNRVIGGDGHVLAQVASITLEVSRG